MSTGIQGGDLKVEEFISVKVLDMKTRIERARADSARILSQYQVVREGITLLRLERVNVMICVLARGGRGSIKVLLVHGRDYMSVEGGYNRGTDMYITSEESFPIFRKYVAGEGIRSLLHQIPHLVTLIERPPGVLIVGSSIGAGSLGIAEASSDWESG